MENILQGFTLALVISFLLRYKGTYFFWNMQILGNILYFINIDAFVLLIFLRNRH